MEAHLMFGGELRCLLFKACKVRLASSSTPMTASRCLGGRAKMLRLYAAIALFSAIVIIEEGQ
jgi:hypothetical protein